MTEQEKMIAGKIYDPGDDELATMRTYAHKMCNRYNKLDEDDEQRKELLEMLIPENNGAYLQGPIFFDYGEFTQKLLCQLQLYRTRLRARHNWRQCVFRTERNNRHARSPAPFKRTQYVLTQ